MRSKKPHKLGNALSVVLLLAFAAAVSIAITWALGKNDAHDIIDDCFTNNPDIKVGISESAWDGWNDYEDTHSQDVNPAITDQSALNALGYNMSKKDGFKAYSVIPKNPTLKNTSVDFGYNQDGSPIGDYNAGDFEIDNASRREWVAIKVEYSLTMPHKVYRFFRYNEGDPENWIIENDSLKTKTITYPGYAKFKAAIASVSVRKPETVKDGDVITGYAAGKEPNGFYTSVSAFEGAPARSEDEGVWHDYYKEQNPDADNDGTFFIYDKILDRGEATHPLFEYVGINGITKDTVYFNSKYTEMYRISVEGAKLGDSPVVNQANTNNKDYLYVTTLPDFGIKITGYAVQADGIDNYNDAAAALKALTDSTLQ